MAKSKKYDFNALLATPSHDNFIFCKFDMRITAVQLKWSGSGNELLPVSRGTGGNDMVDWLYNYHPEKPGRLSASINFTRMTWQYE